MDFAFPVFQLIAVCHGAGYRSPLSGIRDNPTSRTTHLTHLILPSLTSSVSQSLLSPMV